MPAANDANPPDEWLTTAKVADADPGAATSANRQTDSQGGVHGAKIATTAPETSDDIKLVPLSQLDAAMQLAEQLPPDERFSLAARLWVKLSAEQRVALNALQLDSRDRSADIPVTNVQPIWPLIYRALFDPSTTSSLYSAPRRFDLATVFTVTAAYSLLFGGLTLLGATASVKIILGAVVTLVGAFQALLRDVANPRGVSIVTGIVAYTVLTTIAWSLELREWSDPLWFIVILNGLIGGAILGYISGVLVGGVFLVADALRQKFGGPPEESSVGSDGPWRETNETA
jgi:hypothetical protein